MPNEMTATRASSQHRALNLKDVLRRAPAPAQQILEALVAAQSQHALFDPAHPILVAVSGGADSVCLLHALHQLAPVWRLSLHVVHIDHALRPDSADDATFVAALAHKLQLPIYQTRLIPGTLDDDPQGLEAAARSARYGFLRQVAGQLGSHATVVTAHHQDDQAETLLLHLIHGSGLAGLSGMAWVGELPDNQLPAIRLVRPLLGVSRAELHAYLQSYGLTWREDSSNGELVHLRNTLRHQVLPQLAAINPNIHATLARTADLLAAEAAHAEQRDRVALAAWKREYTPSTRIVLDLFHLAQSDQATQRGVLRHALLTLGIDLRAVGMAGIDTLLDQTRMPTASGPHPLIAGWAWTILRDPSTHNASSLDTSWPSPTNQCASFRQVSDETSLRPRTQEDIDHYQLSLHRADASPIAIAHPHFDAPITTPISLPLQGILMHNGWQLHSQRIAPAALPDNWRSGEQPWQLYCDAEQSGALALTTFRAGMSIAPLGMGGKQRAIGDIFTDHKIPTSLRAGWPVVINRAGEVVWLCGLVVAEAVRVQSTTRQVRHVSWQLEMSTP